MGAVLTEVNLLRLLPQDESTWWWLQMRFFQLSGLNAHFRDWQEIPQDHQLLDQNRKIHLALGIKDSGAWYILIPEYDIPRTPRLLTPSLSTEFASLSPFDLESREELSTFLLLHKQAPGKNKKNRGWQRRDTSKANNSYSIGATGSVPIVYGDEFLSASWALRSGTDRDASLHRSAFEHARVLFRAAHGLLDLSKYSIGSSIWKGSIDRIIFFAATPHGLPDTARKVQVPLDLGWATMRFFGPSGTGLETREHFLTSHGILRAKAGLKKAIFKFGTTRFDAYEPHLRALFGRDHSPASKNETKLDGPIILVVYDAVFALRVIQQSGIDVSLWELGLSTLLRQPDLPTYEHGTVQNSSESSRRRSRSPLSRDPRIPRVLSPRANPSDSLTRGRSPSNNSLAPVYVVDVRSLWSLIPETTLPLPSLRELSQKMHIPANNGNWCAGNDVELIYQLWNQFAGGPSIEQYKSIIENEGTEVPDEHEKTVPEPSEKAVDSTLNVGPGGHLAPDDNVNENADVNTDVEQNVHSGAKTDVRTVADDPEIHSAFAAQAVRRAKSPEPSVLVAPPQNSEPELDPNDPYATAWGNDEYYDDDDE